MYHVLPELLTPILFDWHAVRYGEKTERKSITVTFIRFNPEDASLSPALRTGDLLRGLMNLPFPTCPPDRPESKTWSPSLDLYDNKDTFTVALEVAGLRKEDFDISWHDGVLTIAGERPEPAATDGRACFRQERLYGAFSRSVSLPADVQSDQISASYRDGVLTVTLPKAEQAKPKRIEVGVN